MTSINGVVLNIEDEQINYDEGQAPHVNWQATCTVAGTQEELDKLDPRLRPRVLLEVGGQKLSLILTERQVDRPGNTMRLTAESEERIVMEDGSGRETYTFHQGDEAHDSIQKVIRFIIQEPVFQDSGVRGYGWVTAEEPFIIGPGDDALQAILEIGDRAGDRWVYHDGSVWRIRERPELAEEPKAHLTVGEEGNILSSSAGLSREKWYNAVQVVHEWTTEDLDGEGKTVRNERRAEGWAWVKTGPFDVRDVGIKTLKVVRNYAGDGNTAQRAAESLLKRTVTRGRSVDIEAISDESLRPGDTISIQLPTGPVEQHLVSSITFNRPDNTMKISTRVPTYAPSKTGA
jgi:hypothetical protein